VLEVITCMLAGGLIGAMVGAAMMDIRWRRWRNRTLEDGKP
jgi:hypothetical protein